MFGFRSCFAEFRLDLDVICCRGRFDSSWVRVFIDIPIANDANALLQDHEVRQTGLHSLGLVGVQNWNDVRLLPSRWDEAFSQACVEKVVIGVQ